jgi:hypothetical protein
MPITRVEPTYEGASRLRAIVAPALAKLQPHELQRGHPTWMLGELLSNAPLEAEVWDVLGHAFRSGRGVGLPPATAAAPGKALITSMYTIYCEQKEKEEEEQRVVSAGVEAEGEEPIVRSPEQIDNEKKAKYEQWKDMSELLSGAIALMFTKAHTLCS